MEIQVIISEAALRNYHDDSRLSLPDHEVLTKWSDSFFYLIIFFQYNGSKLEVEWFDHNLNLYLSPFSIFRPSLPSLLPSILSYPTSSLASSRHSFLPSSLLSSPPPFLPSFLPSFLSSYFPSTMGRPEKPIFGDPNRRDEKCWEPHTVAPRNTGSQGTNKFHLLLADFCYYQYRKLKELTWRDLCLAFIISGFPLFLGPV